MDIQEISVVIARIAKRHRLLFKIRAKLEQAEQDQVDDHAELRAVFATVNVEHGDPVCLVAGQQCVCIRNDGDGGGEFTPCRLVHLEDVVPFCSDPKRESSD